MATTASAELDARYGRRRRWGRRTRVLVGGLVLLALVAAVVGLWAYIQRPSVYVKAVTLSYDVQSDRRTEVSFRVKKTAGRVAVCRVTAQSDDTRVVGQTEVRIPAEPATWTGSVTLTTAARPITGSVDACAIVAVD